MRQTIAGLLLAFMVSTVGAQPGPQLVPPPTGNVNRAMIAAAVAQVRGRVAACDPSKTANGTVKVTVVVAPDGKVTSATVQSTPDPALGACVASAFKKATFRKTAQGGSFSYPFVFTAPKDPKPPGAGSAGGGSGAQPAPTSTSLDRTAISAGVAAVKSKIMACGAATPVKGSVKVAVTVAPSGAVTSVEVTATPEPKLGACVAGEMQRTTFAATGQGGSFTYPFVF